MERTSGKAFSTPSESNILIIIDNCADGFFAEAIRLPKAGRPKAAETVTFHIAIYLHFVK